VVEVLVAQTTSSSERPPGSGPAGSWSTWLTWPSSDWSLRTSSSGGKKMVRDEDLLTTRDLAKWKGVTARVIQRAAAQGELTPVEAGSGRRPHRFRKADVDDWVPRSDRPRYRYTDEEILGRLRQAQAILAHPPTVEEMASLGPSFPAASTYIRRYGSWRTAIERAEPVRSEEANG
jgi:hypothetical protein